MKSKSIIEDVDGRKRISDDAAIELQELSTKIDELKQQEAELRQQILTGMIENNIDRCTMQNGTTFTQIIPAKIGSFDTDSFILNESEDIVRCFTIFEITSTFDEERFKAEHPEMYEAYSNKSICTNVETDKLQKTLPVIFDKYYSEKDSDKPITLRVTKKRGTK